MINFKEKICFYCGKVFLPTGPNCPRCKECPNPLSKICPCCNQEFKASVSHASQIFCSYKCSGESRVVGSKYNGKEKKCSKCLETKTIENFYKKISSSDGFNSFCKICAKEKSKGRKYGKTRDQSLKHRHNISEEAYKKILEEQNYVCMICKTSDPKNKHNLFVVDHDHACCNRLVNGANISCGLCIRGLLCSPCNTVLGNVRDDVSILNSMIEYLKKQPPIPENRQEEKEKIFQEKKDLRKANRYKKVEK